MKRVKRRDLRKLTPEQRRAYDLLAFGMPGLVGRAEAKLVLGWRRTRAETLAHAQVLAGEGRTRLEVAAELGIDVRYLDRLIGGSTVEIGPEKAPVTRGISGLTNTPKVIALPDRLQGRQMYAGVEGYDFRAALERSSA